MIGVFQQEGLEFFALAEQALMKYLNLKSSDAGSFSFTEYGYDPHRKQYDAKMIVKELVNKKNKPGIKLALVDVDIYVRGMNFIFGLAEPLKKTALVSAYRLKGKNFDLRLAKEVVHEIGHLLGLEHCPVPDCVMYFSNTINDTDHKGPGLCASCRRKIE